MNIFPKTRPGSPVDKGVMPGSVHSGARMVPFLQSASVNPALDRAAKIAVIGLFLIIFAQALYVLSVIILPTCAALIVALLLGPVAGRMERVGVPSYLTASGMVLGVMALVTAFVAALAAPLQMWLNQGPQIWSSLQARLFEFQAALFRLQEVSERVEEITQLSRERAETVVVESSGMLTSAAWMAPSIVGQLALFLVVLYFLLATRSRLRLSIINLCTTRRSRLSAARIMRDMERQTSAYLGVVTLINIGLGVAVGIAMSAMGMPSPALWGALAGLLNYAPFLGPVLMAIILAGVGLVTFDTMLTAVTPAGLFLAINFIEAQFVTPALLGRRFSINPVTILLAVAFWFWLWGPVGAFLATPIVILAMVILAHLALPQLKITIPRRKA